MTPPPHEDTDARDVTNVLLTERAARDLAQWELMRHTFRDDSHVRVSWFQGTGPEFVNASRAMYESGSRSFHEIGALHVEIRDDRALAHANAAVHARGQLDGVEVDVTSYGRLYWRVQRTDGRWLIASLEMLYLKDTLVSADPTRPIRPESLATVGQLRPSYRYLAAVLQAAGHDIDPDLPGSDRPDLIDGFLADHRAWLDPDRCRPVSSGRNEHGGVSEAGAPPGLQNR